MEARKELAIAAAKVLAAKALNKYKEYTNWTLSISDDDDLFLDVQTWLAEAVNATGTRRALAVRTKSTFTFEDSHLGRNAELGLTFDGDTLQRLMIFGHPVTVEFKVPERIGGNDYVRALRPVKIIFRATTKEGRDAVLFVINDINDKKNANSKQPSLYVMGKWDDWRKIQGLPPRTLESVIVKGNIIDDIHRDIKNFVRDEPKYVKLGIPYHRSYLLSGPPGTGKTSTVRALAHVMNMDLWYAQLADLSKDNRLSSLLSEVRGGILLLEDIDSYHAATSRQENHNAISASGLLNALDGVATPHGLITVMTTNYINKLDPALVRPGRVDRTFEFEFPDSDTVTRHFEFFYGKKPDFIGNWPEGKSSAEIAEIFKNNFDDPDRAEQELLFSRRATHV